MKPELHSKTWELSKWINVFWLVNQIFYIIWRTSFHIYNLFITYNFTALWLFLKIAKNLMGSWLALSELPEEAWSRVLYSSPERNPTPKWSPTLKWSPNRPRNDPHFSSCRPGNDPQLILGMEWYSVTELLQVCCSVYILESHFTFHYSLCDFLALLSSCRLYVYFCIINIILKF